MKPRQRPLLIAVSCLALVCPVKVQINTGTRGGIALDGASATAKEGNNGGGKGNGGGNGNGNAGNNGNSGNNGSGGNRGNAGGNNGPSGNNGASGSAGNNGNGRGNSSAGGVSNGSGRSDGNTSAGRSNSASRGSVSSQGGTSNPGGSSSQGTSSSRSNSAGQGKTSDNGKASSRNAGNAPGVSQPASAITGGLSALFGAISDGLRPLTAPPARTLDKPSVRKGSAIGKAASNITDSKQASSSRPGQRSKNKAAIGNTTAGRAHVKSLAADRRRSSHPVMPAAATEQPLPTPIRSERPIVAIGLTSNNLARLSAQGFRTEMQTKGTLASVVRLIPPRGMSLCEAQRKVRVVDANAGADFDHYYYTDEGSACTGPSCEAISLVGWNRSASEQCGPTPTVGLIDTGINRDHEALKGQSIAVLSGLTLRGSPSQRDHGTAVAAILVGRSGSSAPGLLPGARLLAVDAFYRDGGTADRTDVITPWRLWRNATCGWST
jgi:hypothetical protein